MPRLDQGADRSAGTPVPQRRNRLWGAAAGALALAGLAPGAAWAQATVYVAQGIGPDAFEITNDVDPPGLSAGDTVTWLSGSENVEDLVFGTDAFSSISSALAAVGVGGTVEVGPGTYMEGFTVNGRTVRGRDAQSTVVLLPAAGTPQINLGSNATIESLGITREGITAASISVATTSSGQNITIRGCRFYGNRTALYLNGGSSGYTIEDNTFTDNRTGVLFADTTHSNHLFRRNAIHDNLTYGVLLLDTVVNTSGLVFVENYIAGNFASQLEVENAAASVSASANWWGSGQPAFGPRTNNQLDGSVWGANPGPAAQPDWIDAAETVEAPQTLSGNGTISVGSWLADAGAFDPIAGFLSSGIATFNAPTDPDILNASIQTAINTAPAGITLAVPAGTYAENLTIDKAVTLLGANAGTPGNGTRVAESIIVPASGLPINVTADGVTIDGFEITAPSYHNAIVGNGRSDLAIANNRIVDINTAGVNANTHAIQYTVPNAPAAPSNVSVTDNLFSNIGASTLEGFSASAIGILQSPTTGTLSNLVIEGNLINGVRVSNSPWPTGKIAYGILVNVGGNANYLTNGKVVGAQITDNIIGVLSGHIATGIGLEGNTEDAVVTGNEVFFLQGTKVAGRAGGGYDLQALKFENNRYAGTATVDGNFFRADSFNHSDPAGVGYAVANYVPAAVGGIVRLGCNWLGSADPAEIADNATLTGLVFNKAGAATEAAPFSTTSALPLVCDGAGPIQNGPDSFISLQVAINDAAPGDTITVTGPVFGSVVVDKPLMIVGQAATRAKTPIVGTPGLPVYTIASDGVTIDNMAITGTIGVLSDGFTDLAVTDNDISAEFAGIAVGSAATSPGSTVTLAGNNVTVTGPQIVATPPAGFPSNPDGNPTIGIGLFGIVGTAAAVVDANDVHGAFWGYLAYAVGTSPTTTISDTAVTGATQGIAVVNTIAVGDPWNYAGSVLAIEDASVTAFAPVIAPGVYQFGLYTNTGSASTNPATEGLVVTATNLTVTGVQEVVNEDNVNTSAAVAAWDFGFTASGDFTDTMQSVTILDSSLTGTDARGVDARSRVEVSVQGSEVRDHGFLGLSARGGAAIDIATSVLERGAGNGALMQAAANVASPANHAPSSIVAENNSIVVTGGGNFSVGSGGTIALTCNWWGTTDEATIATYSGSFNAVPYLVSSDLGNPACVGGGPVLNTTQGIPYASLAAALDFADEDDVLFVSAGASIVLAEHIEITVEGVTITTDADNPATIAYNGADFFPIFEVFAPGVTISNLTLVRDNATSGGQAIAVRKSDVSILDNTIITNDEPSPAPAITVDHGLPAEGYTGDVSNILIEGNQILGQWTWGFGIRTSSNNGTLSGVSFVGNSFDGALNGGFVFAAGGDPGNVTNVSFVGNDFNVANRTIYDDTGAVDLPAFVADNTLNLNIVFLTDGTNILPGWTFSTIQSAINAAPAGATVEPQAGIYEELLTVGTSVTLSGTGNPSLRAPESPVRSLAEGIIVVNAANVTIEGFAFDVDRSLVRNGVFVPQGNTFDGLVVDNNVFSSYGTNSEGFETRSGAVDIRADGVNQSATITRNIIQDGTGALAPVADSTWPRGIFLRGGAATIGGGAGLGNTVRASFQDILFQFATDHAPSAITHNTLTRAGLDITEPNGSTNTITVASNIVDAPNAIQGIIIKHNYNSRPVVVSGNTVSVQDGRPAIYSGGSDNVVISGNTINFPSSPVDGGIGILVDTDFPGTGLSNASLLRPANNTQVIGNQFVGPAAPGAPVIGLAFRRGVSGGLERDLGTMLVEGNTFSGSLDFTIVLDSDEDTALGSSASPLDAFNAGFAAAYASPARTVLPFDADIDVSTNLFVTASSAPAAILPSAMAPLDQAEMLIRSWDQRDESAAGLLDFGFTPPAVVYVDDDYAGESLGDLVDFGATTDLVFGIEAFASIQDGVDAVAVAGQVNVAAGTYAENVVVDKAADIRGPNYGVSGSATRSAEAVIIPATDGSADTFFTTVVLVEADGVSIDGFTIDGENTSLPANNWGVTGASLHAANGIFIREAEAATIRNNIIRNTGFTGVNGASIDTVARTGSVVSDNRIEDLGAYTGTYNRWGVGIVLRNSWYAHVVDNTIEGVRVGVQINGIRELNPGAAAYQRIADNTISARARGIFHNPLDANHSPFTISGNTISGIDHPEEDLMQGMLLQRLVTTTVFAEDNTIDLGAVSTADSRGIEVYSNNAPAMVADNTVNNANIMVLVTNNSAQFPINGHSGFATISGLSGSPNPGGRAIVVEDLDGADGSNPGNASATITGSTLSGDGTGSGVVVIGSRASATIVDNTATISGFAIGVDVDGGTATIANNAIFDNGTGIRIANGGEADIDGNDFRPVGLADPNAIDIATTTTAAAMTVGGTTPNIFDGSNATNGFFDHQAPFDVPAGNNEFPSILGAGVLATDATAAQRAAIEAKIVDVKTNASFGDIILGSLTLFVDIAAAGAGTGESWADAFTTINGALALAASGDQVWIADGVYNEAIVLNGLSVSLYGGFEGAGGAEETLLAERDWTRNYTIVTPPVDSRGLTVLGTADVVVDSIAFVDALAASGDNGGAVLFNDFDGTALLARSVVQGNASADGQGGGGIAIVGGSADITLEQVVAVNNSAVGGSLLRGTGASDGGGLLVANASGTIEVRESYLVGNIAEGAGGGLAAANAADLRVRNLVAGGNAATFGSAASLSAGTNALIAHMSASHNNAAGSGGSIVAAGASTDTTIVNTLVAYEESLVGIVERSGAEIDVFNAMFDDTTAWTAAFRDNANTNYATGAAATTALARVSDSIDGDPMLRVIEWEAGLTGAWTAVSYDPATGLTTLTTTGTPFFTGIEFQRFLDANVLDGGAWALVVSNTASSLRVMGDMTGRVSVGDQFKVWSWVPVMVNDGTDAGIDPTSLWGSAIDVDVFLRERPVQLLAPTLAESYDIGAYEVQDDPLFVDLVSFTASAVRGRTITIQWETSTEIDNAGFNLYRSTASGVEKLTQTLIAPLGDEFTGAVYTFVDTTYPDGWTEMPLYFLEDVEFSGLSTIHGPAVNIVTEAPKGPSLDPSTDSGGDRVRPLLPSGGDAVKEPGTIGTGQDALIRR